MNETERSFNGNDKLRILIRKNPHLLPVLSRFNIALGFGDSTVSDVCRRRGVHTETFLAVCNYFTSRIIDIDSVDLNALVDYLKSSHRYFLDYVLPGIRTKLISAITPGNPGDFAWMLVSLYDEYVGEVRKHMNYEDENVFEYVANLCKGLRQPGFSIAEFKDNHLPIADKLRDIKELFIGHYTAEEERVDSLNSVLFDLMMCEHDIMLHCALEDHVFIPAVERLERSEDRNVHVRPQTVDDNTESQSLDEHGDVVLTPRERDIVRAIAQGWTNKEIAERLFLSIHTVTTHRRNISAKLNIHSAQGVTVYALMHGIITLDELS